MPEDQLTGWKDIASYLGRSVRTVQRWERELELPVHRIQSAAGQTVYAKRDELDAWLSSVDADKASRPNAFFTRFWVATAVSAVVLLVTVVLLNQPGVGPPTRFALLDTEVVALDRRDQVVWSSPFDGQVSQAGVFNQITPVVADLDQDGEVEVLVAVQHSKSDQRARVSDSLYCFDLDGTQCWEVQSATELWCAGEDFQAPWRISAVEVLENTDGSTEILVAFVHTTFWPSFVLKIDAEGNAVPLYVQAGWITSLASWPAAGESAVIAGGVLNEFGRASIAVLDAARGATVSPAGDPQFDCTAEVSEHPERLVLLPTLDAQSASAPYPMVRNLLPVDDRLEVLYDTGRAPAVGRFNPRFDLEAVVPTDTYWQSHSELEATGVLRHPAEVCPERSMPLAARSWSRAGGWAELAVRRTTR